MEIPELYVPVADEPLPSELLGEIKTPGEVAFNALKQAVDELVASAPKDHDVCVAAFDLIVSDVRYLDSGTLMFRGVDSQGSAACAIVHYTQLVARVIYLPKRGNERVVTGFQKVKQSQ